MTKTWHKRTAVASMFQNGISRNTKCAKRDGFCREGHIYCYAHKVFCCGEAKIINRVECKFRHFRVITL